MNQTLRHSRTPASSVASQLSPVADGVEVRPLTRPAEFQACVELQEEVWGPGYTDRVTQVRQSTASNFDVLTQGPNNFFLRTRNFDLGVEHNWGRWALPRR